MGAKRILVIDDEENFAALLKENLEQAGPYQVTVAKDGRQGIRLACKEHPDLILLDILMPGMGGFEVLQALKKNLETLGIPVIMLSAVTDKWAKQEAARLYNEYYIEKPVPIEVLKSKIELVLSKK